MFNPYYGCAVHEHVSGISKKNENYLRPENHIEMKLRKEATARLEKLTHKTGYYLSKRKMKNIITG